MGRERAAFLTLGLRFSTATLGAMAAVGWIASQRFRGDSGRQGHTVGAYKEERQAELRTEAKAKEAQASRPPESESKCGRRTDGRRPQLRFCVNKVALFPVLAKKKVSDQTCGWAR